MAIRLTDLRKVALREYPEFGETPWPVPWWKTSGGLLVLHTVFVLAVFGFLIIMQTITGG